MRTASQSGLRRRERPLAVDWQDCDWCPLIAVQPRWGEAPDEAEGRVVSPRRPKPWTGGPASRPYLKRLAEINLRLSSTATSVPSAKTTNHGGIRSPRAVKQLSALPRRSPLQRHDPLFFKTMKKLTMKCDKTEGGRRPRAAFTLVELLTVIAVIAILAAMLLTALAGVKAHALKMKAHLEEAQIVNAIEKYDSDYGRFPVSTNAQFAASNAGSDYTYGWVFDTPSGPYPVPTYPGSGVVVSNAEVIAILMDNTNLANGVNAGHIKNPRQTIFMSPKMSGYDPSTPGPAEGGVDVNGVYRDPWGNPYVISMDLNYDDNCKDSFYCLQKVSQANGQTGYNGLYNSDTAGTTDNFQYHGKVMVWSAGPNGKIDQLDPANDRENKDNVLSWQ